MYKEFLPITAGFHLVKPFWIELLLSNLLLIQSIPSLSLMSFLKDPMYAGHHLKNLMSECCNVKGNNAQSTCLRYLLIYQSFILYIQQYSAPKEQALLLLKLSKEGQLSWIMAGRADHYSRNWAFHQSCGSITCLSWFRLDIACWGSFQPFWLRILLFSAFSQDTYPSPLTILMQICQLVSWPVTVGDNEARPWRFIAFLRR